MAALSSECWRVGMTVRRKYDGMTAVLTHRDGLGNWFGHRLADGITSDTEHFLCTCDGADFEKASKQPEKAVPTTSTDVSRPVTQSEREKLDAQDVIDEAIVERSME